MIVYKKTDNYIIQCRPHLPPCGQKADNTHWQSLIGHDGCRSTLVNLKSPGFKGVMAWYERTVSARSHRQRALLVRKLDAAFAQQRIETAHIVLIFSSAAGALTASQCLISHLALFQLDPCGLGKGRAALAGETSTRASFLFFWFDRKESHFWKSSFSTRKSSPALLTPAGYYIKVVFQNFGISKNGFPTLPDFFSVQTSKKSLLMLHTAGAA